MGINIDEVALRLRSGKPAADSSAVAGFEYGAISGTLEIPAITQPIVKPMIQSTLDLKLLTPLDWRVLRKARLEALLDSPHAFTSSYVRELLWTELEWRRMFDAATWTVAREAEEVIGLARSVREPDRLGARHLESVWVAPTHRRRGVFRALLHTIAETESQIGVTELLIWVMEDNRDAQRAYEAVGFQPTGERQFLPVFGRFERRVRVCVNRLLGP